MNLSNYAEKLDDLLTVDGLKNNWTLPSLFFVFLLALYLRYLPEQGMAYLQALDPYMIYRMSQHFAFSGNLPPLDFMRYFPYATPTYLLNQGDIIFPAIMYWLGGFLFFNSYLEWAQFFPALMGALGVVAGYFFSKEVWNERAGLAAAFLLATIPGIMHRTSAGFFEKEPLGTFFMMTSLYFFTRAWKRKDHVSGILSGLMLGFFTISWGGSKMMWLLYPMVVGLVMFFNEDIRKLTIAYTPTVLVGGITAAALNQSRFWFTGTLFLLNMGMLGFLWSRRLVEEFDVIEEKFLWAYVPVMSMIGGLVIALSPLFSQFMAGRLMGFITTVTQSGGAVIAGTVAENTPATLGQLVSQYSAITFLSSVPALPRNILTTIAVNVVSPWTFTMIGIPLLLTAVALMFMRKFDFIGHEISSKAGVSIFGGMFLAWITFFYGFFTVRSSPVLFALYGAVSLALFAVPVLMFYFMDDETAYTMTGLLMFVIAGLPIGKAYLLGGQGPSYAIAPSAILVLAAYGLFGMKESEDIWSIEFNWYYMLPLMWGLTNILGAIDKSRLVFLGAFPVAVLGGYALSKGYDAIKGFELPEMEGIDSGNLKIAVIGALALLLIVVNFGAGFVNANSLGGSPNQLWMQNLDYMESETPEDSVIMSWWDYGYWFESIGRRAAVADGGNMGYYTSKTLGKVNYPIADFLTSDSPSNYTWLFEKHSVDYVVLDESMIGKYAAVSQISNRDNTKYESMFQVSTRRNVKGSLTGNGSSTTLTFSRRGMNVYLPVTKVGSEYKISGAPTVETNRGRFSIGCVLTENGRTDFNVEGNLGYCVGVNPFYSIDRAFAAGSQAKLVLIPKKISDSTLVRLYIMDGQGIDFLEKVPAGSNDYVKMWKVKDLE